MCALCIILRAWVAGNHDMVINGSIATQIQFDTSGASPVSAASPLAPAATKLWNAPRAFYSEDYAINGVRAAARLKPARCFCCS